MIDPADIRKIVIPAAAGVGNAIFAMPLVRQLYRGLNQPQITVIAFGRGIGGVFESMKEVAEVKVSGPGHRGFLRFIRWTRQRRPDLYLVPYPSNRWEYNVLIAANAARHTLVHGYPVGRWRTLAWINRATRVSAVAGIHDVHQNLRLLTALGISPDFNETPRFEISLQNHANGEAILRSIGIGSETPFIVIHPGSGDTGWGLAKRWSAKKFAELCSRLNAGTCQHIVLIEGPDEPGLASCVADRVSSGISISVLRMQGSLADSAAVLKRASLYVGSDSAVAHLAAAVGTPTVVLYAPTDPATCRPLGSGHRSICLKKSCSPCFSYPLQTPYPAVRCREPLCINEITVEEVAEQVEQVLAALSTIQVCNDSPASTEETSTRTASARDDLFRRA